MADEIVEKRGRGRPKGTGGNSRPDKTVQLEPGDNQKYIMHDLSVHLMTPNIVPTGGMKNDLQRP